MQKLIFKEQIVIENKRNLKEYFKKYRDNVIGQGMSFESPFGTKEIIYGDWTASGRLYKPIEDKIAQDFGPFVANTHTETSVTGAMMTRAYHEAQRIIKEHVNAKDSDILIAAGSGATRQINKFQRILGLKIPDGVKDYLDFPKEKRPVIFITHMEHHSNHTSWLETLADVVVIEPDKDGLVDLENFAELLEKYEERERKILAVTAASNVTGIQPPYHKMAKMIHRKSGLCFVDFACSAPYVDINMHPEDREERLDAIYFSPHKFLGGPGSAGILLFNDKLYTNRVPDNPGGGTVKWTNPWGEYSFFDNIEIREDGGTPAFLQTIRTALAIKLKNEMGVENILAREHELVPRLLDGLSKIDGLHILASQHRDRLGVISFYLEGMHYNLISKLLNDRFGVQVRGGCSCAGTYGHYLLHVSHEFSNSITEQIDAGVLDDKPGWVRMSIHPVMTEEEMDFMVNAVKEVAANYEEWGRAYTYDNHTNEYSLIGENIQTEKAVIDEWFNDWE